MLDRCLLSYGRLATFRFMLPWSEVESVAQLVEHRPFKALVLGSSPSALTIISIT